MNELTKDIKDLIKQIRKSNNFTQDAFAKNVLNISKRHYIRIESGEASISLENFLKIIDYFSLNIYELSQTILSNKTTTQFINGLLHKLKTPEINNQEILKNIETFLLQQESKGIVLSPNETKTLEMIETFVLYKIYEDTEYLNYFIKNNYDYISNNSRAISLMLPILSTNEIVTLLKKNYSRKLKNVRESGYISISVHLNALGLLLEKKYSDTKYLSFIFDTILKQIKAEHAYMFLPIFFRHRAVFYYMIKDIEEYIENKAKSLTLAEIYETKAIYNLLVEDFKTIESD